MTRLIIGLSWLILVLPIGLPARDAIQVVPAAQPLTVTYIANTGFLVEAAGKKVLIDALFDGGAPDNLTPSPELLERIESGSGPFATIDLVLATHAHGDHFSPALVTRYLRAHPHSHFAGHKQVIDRLRADASFERVNAQIHEFDLADGARGRFAYERIAVDALCLRHGAPQREVENLVFLVDLGGARFLHMGDTFFWDHENDAAFAAYPFERSRVGVLFLNQYDRGPARTKAIIENRVKPAHLVVTHVGPGEAASVSPKIAAAFPGAVVFETSMEQRTFK